MYLHILLEGVIIDHAFVYAAGTFLSSLCIAPCSVKINHMAETVFWSCTETYLQFPVLCCIVTHYCCYWLCISCESPTCSSILDDK